MGTKAHKPQGEKSDWHGGNAPATKAAGPGGERPGVPSRIEAARERIRRRERL